MPKKHDIIEITGDIYRESDAAYLFSDGTTKTDEYGNKFPVKTWVPKSQCDWESTGDIKNGAIPGVLQIPEWLALEKELI